MRYLILSLLALFVFICDVYATTAQINHPQQSPQEVITDEYLRTLAVEKGVVKENWKDIGYDDELRERNTIVMWILFSGEEKTAVVDGFKDAFKQRGINIERASEYYVSEINNVIYRNILTGDVTNANKKGLGVIFKTLVLMEGDFGDGKDKIESLREYIGQEKFDEYKKAYPKKYERLLKTSVQ